MRLVKAGVVEFDFAEGSRRDMIANLTDEGLKARKVGLEIAGAVEDMVRDKIGDADLETLRRILVELNK